MALNHRPFHKSYRNKFNGFLYLTLNFVKLNFPSHSGWNHNRSWNGIPAPKRAGRIKIPAQVIWLKKQVM